MGRHSFTRTISISHPTTHITCRIEIHLRLPRPSAANPSSGFNPCLSVFYERGCQGKSSPYLVAFFILATSPVAVGFATQHLALGFCCGCSNDGFYSALVMNAPLASLWPIGSHSDTFG